MPPPLPWKSLAEAASDREYLFLISYLPLKRFSMIPRFLNYTRKVRRQLAGSEGLIGYSLLAKIGTKEFWTLSVWEDGRALSRFVGRMPHREVMSALDPHMGQTKFVRWQGRGSEVPPDWGDARARLQSGT